MRPGPRSSDIRLYGFAFLTTALLALQPNAASAARKCIVTIPNNTGFNVARLHLGFAGAGAALTVDPATVFATTDCEVASVPSNSVASDSAVIIWDANCVRAGGAVAFVADTPAGPIGVTGGYWVDSLDVVVGAVDSVYCDTLPSPSGPETKWKIVFRVRIKQQRLGYSAAYFLPPFCVERWCCLFPAERILEIGFEQYIKIADRWVATGAYKVWRRITIEVLGEPKWVRQADSLPQGWGPVIQGPIPDPPSSDEIAKWATKEVIVKSNDAGSSYSLGADFPTTFHDVGSALHIEGDTTTVPINFSENLMFMAPAYQVASDRLEGLVDEGHLARVAEPGAFVNGVSEALDSMQTALSQVSNQFASGSLTDSSPFDQLAVSFDQFSQHLRSLSIPRIDDAADNADDMRDAFTIAADEIDAGLPNAASMGSFLWSQWNGFRESVTHFGNGMMPHARVSVDLGNYAWLPSTVSEVQVKVYEHQSGDLLHEDYVPLSDRSEFDVFLPFTPGTALRLWFKLPTYLSHEVYFESADAIRLGPFLLRPGDVNGDDCVDSQDEAMVSADFGAGGASAPFVPSSDANANGIVDLVDLAIVQGHLGECGPITTAATPQQVRVRLDASVPNPFVRDALIAYELARKSAVRLTVYGVRGQRVRRLIAEEQDAGPHSIVWDGMDDSGRPAAAGLYFIRLAIEGSGGETTGLSTKVVRVR